MPEDGPVPGARLQPGSVALAARNGQGAKARADSSGSPGKMRLVRLPCGLWPSQILPTDRRRSFLTATAARWASSSRAASIAGFSTGWVRRISTDRSAPRRARSGYEYTMGRGRLGADPLAVPKCKFIVNWGSNTVNTNSHLWSLMIEARKAGATIVTIDPYRSPTASRSDWHIQPRPGTDAALALGVLHVVWRDGLQDEEYFKRATVGAERAAGSGRQGIRSRKRRGDHRC